jgi:hypothetical protein
MNKDKATINGLYGVEEGEMQGPFKILKKEVKSETLVTPVAQKGKKYSFSKIYHVV